jgi:hypothetical protein
MRWERTQRREREERGEEKGERRKERGERREERGERREESSSEKGEDRRQREKRGNCRGDSPRASSTAHRTQRREFHCEDSLRPHESKAKNMAEIGEYTVKWSLMDQPSLINLGMDWTPTSHLCTANLLSLVHHIMGRILCYYNQIKPIPKYIPIEGQFLPQYMSFSPIVQTAVGF